MADDDRTNGWSRYEKQVLYQLEAIDAQVKDLDRKVEQRVSDVQNRINELAARDIAGIRTELKANRHDLAGKLAAVALRVDKLEYQHADHDRRFAENDERAAKYIPLIDHLLTKETLALQMKKAGWTRRERLLAYGLFLFAFVGALGTVVSLIVLTQGGS